jgi:hypothetical protein
MLPYIQRRMGSQLLHLLLALALFAIPLNRSSAAQKSLLLPLRTTFVPFDATIEPPTPTVVQFSVAGASSKRAIFAPAANSFALQCPTIAACDLPSGRVRRYGATRLPGARSPPEV